MRIFEEKIRQILINLDKELAKTMFGEHVEAIMRSPVHKWNAWLITKNGREFYIKGYLEYMKAKKTVYQTFIEILNEELEKTKKEIEEIQHELIGGGNKWGLNTRNARGGFV